MHNKIFVYGSLMKNFYNYDRYLRGHVLNVAPATTSGILYDMPYKGYPALIAGNETVHGEVITVKDLAAIQPRLDALENFNNQKDDEYRRVLSDIILEDGTHLKLDVYVYAQQDTDPKFQHEAIHIPNGDWKAFKKAQ